MLNAIRAYGFLTYISLELALFEPISFELIAFEPILSIYLLPSLFQSNLFNSSIRPNSILLPQLLFPFLLLCWSQLSSSCTCLSSSFEKDIHPQFLQLVSQMYGREHPLYLSYTHTHIYVLPPSISRDCIRGFDLTLEEEAR